ncbi:ABC-2 domain containing protein [Secundilactobacillus odoratitofui DSM 19909 = JCM 15043]|uniref:Transport permease protein n=1 Tax=Secundilactobacillus odoratitofui DSM 19909 = JCM 15043 TaxID=1423776 RepID=A0A0R1LVT1_9LACO|nr:ABC transporter permease [Secundilactobacillus odoratitofui]KRK97057.1 ABC-2 domain containing protein [Secundilactobacillus odoratitofui DSM 19909 = JCM 15043]
MQTIKQLTALVTRIVRQNLTNADTLITVIAMPVFMLLFFVYAFGGNIVTATGPASSSEYLRYALPGFLLLTMAMGSAYTALRINYDQTSGFLNRLHTLPIPRWVILGSHVIASVIFMLLAEVVVFLTGLLMCYRTDAGITSIVAFWGLSLLFSVAITLLAIPFSLKAADYASAGGFSYLLLMLLFVSSALMPTAGMAKPVRLFANHQPMTPIVNTARGLLDHSMAVSNHTLWLAMGWLGACVIIFSGLSYWVYSRLFLHK